MRANTVAKREGDHHECAPRHRHVRVRDGGHGRQKCCASAEDTLVLLRAEPQEAGLVGAVEEERTQPGHEDRACQQKVAEQAGWRTRTAHADHVSEADGHDHGHGVDGEDGSDEASLPELCPTLAWARQQRDRSVVGVPRLCVRQDDHAVAVGQGLPPGTGDLRHQCSPSFVRGAHMTCRCACISALQERRNNEVKSPIPNMGLVSESRY